MFAANAVNAAMPLYQPHGVPRQVVVHDATGLLQVDTLGQHVGGEQQVEAILRLRLAVVVEFSRSLWREASQDARPPVLIENWTALLPPR